MFTYVVMNTAFILHHTVAHVEAVEKHTANPERGLGKAEQDASLVDKVDALCSP